MADQVLFDADGNEVIVPEESPNVRQMRERIKELETQAQRAADLEAQFATQQREAAISGAGLELDATQRAALEAVHTGEWTPEALKATAVNLKWAQPSGPTPEELAAMQRVNDANTGGGTPPPNPEADIDARLAQAKTQAEFMEIYAASGRQITPS